jgi:hypothetical protein
MGLPQGLLIVILLVVLSNSIFRRLPSVCMYVLGCFFDCQSVCHNSLRFEFLIIHFSYFTFKIVLNIWIMILLNSAVISLCLNLHLIIYTIQV